MFCSSCGKQLAEGASFCGFCGAPQYGAYQPGNQPQQYGTYQPGNQQQYGAYQQPLQNPIGNGLYQGAGIATNMAGSIVQGGIGAAHKAINTKLIMIIAVALVAIASILYYVFIMSGTPEDTVEKLETALNNLDQNELLECFDQQTQDLYSGALSFGGSLLGIDLDGLSDLTSGLGGMLAASGLTPRYQLNVVDIEYNGDKSCLVTVEFVMSFQGETESETVPLPMTKEGREWRISMAAAYDFLGGY